MTTTEAQATVTVDMDRMAYALLVAHIAADAANPRTKTGANLQGRFLGMCEALDRLGLVPTPFAAHMAVLDAIRAAPSPRPDFRPVNNREQQEWDAAVAAQIARNLQA